jgi:hypothetical protein
LKIHGILGAVLGVVTVSGHRGRQGAGGVFDRRTAPVLKKMLNNEKKTLANCIFMIIVAFNLYQPRRVLR